MLKLDIIETITIHAQANADLRRRASVPLCQFGDGWVPQSLSLGQGAVPRKHDAPPHGSTPPAAWAAGTHGTAPGKDKASAVS